MDSPFRALSKVFWVQLDPVTHLAANGAQRRQGNREATLPTPRRLFFRDFATDCFVRSFRTQKMNCRTFQELSIGYPRFVVWSAHSSVKTQFQVTLSSSRWILKFFNKSTTLGANKTTNSQPWGSWKFTTKKKNGRRLYFVRWSIDKWNFQKVEQNFEKSKRPTSCQECQTRDKHVQSAPVDLSDTFISNSIPLKFNWI